MNFLEKSKEHYISTTIKGIFWLLPILAIAGIIVWFWKKIDWIVGEMFKLVGIIPQNNVFFWTLFGLIIMISLFYLTGHFVESNLAHKITNLLSKIPGYQTLKDLIDIFNSSKKGEQKVLVVLVKGFAKEGYTIGLMYSKKESILKDHYTVVLSQTPIPNGGYMFEVPKDKILVIEEAVFDDNLQYLLSMGTKSLPEIMGIESKELSELPTLTEYLKGC